MKPLPYQIVHFHQDLMLYMNQEENEIVTSWHPLHHAHLWCPSLQNRVHSNCKKSPKQTQGISPLETFGIGLFVATFSVVTFALVEKKRPIAAFRKNETLSILDCSTIPHLQSLSLKKSAQTLLIKMQSMHLHYL